MTRKAGTRRGQVRGSLPEGWRDQRDRFTPEERAEHDLAPSYRRDKISYTGHVMNIGDEWRWMVLANDDRRSVGWSGFTSTALAGIRAANRYLNRFP